MQNSTAFFRNTAERDSLVAEDLSTVCISCGNSASGIERTVQEPS
jgi:hypothetical protein